MPLCQTQMRQALRRSAGSLLGSWQLELCLGTENSGASKNKIKSFKLCQQKFHLLAKFHLAKQLEHQKMPERGKASVFPQLCKQAEEYPRDLLSPSGCGGAST